MATQDDNNHAICNHKFKKRIELRTHEQPRVAEHQGRTDSTMKRSQQPPHTQGTLHRRLQPLYMEKHTVSCSGFLPNTSPMQHSCSHYTAFCSITWQACMYLRTWQHQMTTIMQPFQCDLQSQVQETHRTTHTWTTTRCRTPKEEPIRRWNDRSRNRRTHKVHFIAACSHFTGKHTRFRAPASSPTQAPCNIHAAITLRFVASRGKPACIYAHGNTRWQQSCSHSNAICNHKFKKRIELRTHEQPHVAEHQRKNRFEMKRSQPQPPHTQGTYHRRLQPLYGEKHKVLCSGVLPNTSPMQHSCSHYNAFCSITWQACMCLRTWQHKMTTIMQPFQCDLQPCGAKCNVKSHPSWIFCSVM